MLLVEINGLLSHRPESRPTVLPVTLVFTYKAYRKPGLPTNKLTNYQLCKRGAAVKATAYNATVVVAVTAAVTTVTTAAAAAAAAVTA